MSAITDREAYLEQQLSELSGRYTAICDKYDTVSKERDVAIKATEIVQAANNKAIAGLQAELAAVRGDLMRWQEKASLLELELEVVEMERDRLREAVDDLVKDMRAVDGCFEAAYFEGWIEALADANDDRINDLYNRRIEYARHTAINAIAKHTQPQPENSL